MWSPHRESRLVQVFKAALSARPESWNWCDNPHHASWWVIDGTLPNCFELTAPIEREKAEHVATYKVMLASLITHHHNPGWTFFKVPLNTALLFRWIDSCLSRKGRSESQINQKIKLTRWPNISSYSEGLSPTACMQLTMACSRLLEDWVELDSVQQLVGHPERLERLLKDAEKSGILKVREMSRNTIENLALTGITPDTNQVNQESNRPAGLLNRIIRKFT